MESIPVCVRCLSLPSLDFQEKLFSLVFLYNHISFYITNIYVFCNIYSTKVTCNSQLMPTFFSSISSMSADTSDLFIRYRTTEIESRRIVTTNSSLAVRSAPLLCIPEQFFQEFLLLPNVPIKNVGNQLLVRSLPVRRPRLHGGPSSLIESRESERCSRENGGVALFGH